MIVSDTLNYNVLPEDLPMPEDDGACDHLPGLALPSLRLVSTAGRSVDLSAARGKTLVYCYPRTGRPGQPLPTGWDAIPGARGCTPQACAFRDYYGELQSLGIDALFGLSTQDTDYQRELVERLHLPFEVLSDTDLRFTRALRLPTFSVDGMTLIKRLTLVLHEGMIEHVFYPIFPPDKHADEVM